MRFVANNRNKAYKFEDGKFIEDEAYYRGDFIEIIKDGLTLSISGMVVHLSRESGHMVSTNNLIEARLTHYYGDGSVNVDCELSTFL